MNNNIDTVGFARLISRITAMTSSSMEQWQVEDLLDAVKSCLMTPSSVSGEVPAAKIDLLLEAIQWNKKIDAIKAYRSLTGVGLKEAKDAVERYWYTHDIDKPTMGDMLDSARNRAY